MQGTVKWFDDSKGFGFIVPSDGGADIFVHYSDVEGDGRKSLTEGDTVTYEAGEGERGPKAVNVQVSNA